MVKWLREGGLADALCPVPTGDGQTMTEGLLRAASAIGHLEVVRELLERGGERRLANRPRLHRARGCCGPRPHLSLLLLLLQQSANLDLQSNKGGPALMLAAGGGQEACVQALLRAKANTERHCPCT